LVRDADEMTSKSPHGAVLYESFTSASWPDFPSSTIQNWPCEYLQRVGQPALQLLFFLAGSRQSDDDEWCSQKR